MTISKFEKDLVADSVESMAGEIVKKTNEIIEARCRDYFIQLGEGKERENHLALMVVNLADQVKELSKQLETTRSALAAEKVKSEDYRTDNQMLNGIIVTREQELEELHLRIAELDK